MAYYKIKNITNTLGKRDIQKDQDLTIKLNNGLFPVNEKITKGQEVLMECGKLPSELQKLRVQGLVTIVEISKNEYLSQLKENDKPKPPKDPDEDKSKKKTTSRKTTSGSTTKSTKSTSNDSSSSSKSSSSKKKSSSSSKSTTEIISDHIQD